VPETHFQKLNRKQKYKHPPKKILSKRLTRRAFIKYGLRTALLILIGSAYSLRDNVKTETIRLHFSSLPSSFHGLRIVQISDLHASFWVTRAYLSRVVDQINAMEKDIVVITGDILTGSVNSFLKHWLPDDDDTYLSMVIDVLRQLDGGSVKLAVLGNHDQGDGSENTRKLTYELDKIGFKVLRNDSLTLTHGDEQVFIAGTDDLWFSCDLPKTLADVPENAFTILLSHNPDITTEIRKKMQIDLTLCGHTHGGQIAIPFLTDYLMPISNPGRYMAGLVREDYGYTYVNRGIGTLVFPFRLGASPEITSFHLACSDARQRKVSTCAISLCRVGKVPALTGFRDDYQVRQFIF